MKPLLILVDLQHDYLNAPDLEPPAGTVVAGAASLAADCRGHGIPVAHVWTTVSRDPDNRMPHWQRANIWRCEAGTPGHQPPEALLPLDGERVFHKTGLSALSPSFEHFLGEAAVDTVILAGVKAHACVRQLALEAWHAGKIVWIAADAISSDDPLHAAATRRFLEARGIEFLSEAELDARLNPAARTLEDQEPARSTSPATAAHGFFDEWRGTPFETRAALVTRLAEILAAEVDSFAKLMATELGKPLRLGRAEMEHTLSMLTAITRRAECHGDVRGTGAAWSVRRRPLGAIAVITPWNNPVLIALGKIVPAVLFGNAVVWKPAPEARLLSRALDRSFKRADWPQHLVTLLEGGRREAEALMNDPSIRAVTITASTANGFTAQEICGRRRIPLQAELGGNNAAIVWLDADMERAARLIAAGAFEMAGQRCTANRRVIVHEQRRDELLALLTRETSFLRWGDPQRDDTDIGPLVSAAHCTRVAAAVARATARGGDPILPSGDQRPPDRDYPGRFYPPTILCCDDPMHEIVQEETFGPVLVVQPAQDWDHAMRLCNGVRQGLAAAAFTSSPDIARKFLEQADAGILKINQSTAGAAVDAPFGGWKSSGVGLPEHGDFDLEFFTRPQTVYGDPAEARS